MGNSEIVAWSIVLIYIVASIAICIKGWQNRGRLNEEISFGASLKELRMSFREGADDQDCLSHLYMMKLKFQSDDHQKEIDDLIEIFTK